MPTLKIFNKDFPDFRVGFKSIIPPGNDPQIDPKSYLTNNDVRSVFDPARGIAFSTTNKLKLVLNPITFGIRNQEGVSEVESPSVFWRGLATQGVGAWNSSLWFKSRAPTSSGLDRDQYEIVSRGPLDVILNGDEAEIEVTETFINGVKNQFAQRAISLPREGMLRLVFEHHQVDKNGDDPKNRVVEFIWVRCTFGPITNLPETTGGPVAVNVTKPPSVTVVPSVAIFGTKATAYENLHVPALSASFVYNYYQVNEESLNATRRKNYSLKKLSEVPRYVELNWTPSPPVLISRPPLTSSFKSFVERQTISSLSSRLEDQARSISGQGAEESNKGRFPSRRTSKESFYGLNDGRPNGGSRVKPEIRTRSGYTLRLGGATFSIGGQIEEEASIFSSRTQTAQLANDLNITPSIIREASNPSSPLQRQIESVDVSRLLRRPPQPRDPENFEVTDQLVGDDTTLNLGLSDEQNIFLNQLVRDVDQPDAIAGPNEFSRYIGYVILKERFNPELDNFEVIDMLVLLDRRKTRIVDTKVAYNDTYRYKIRSVYKFVNVDNLPLFRDQDSILSRSVVSVYDGGQPFKNAFYFDSRFSNPVEVTCNNDLRPDPPFNIQLFPHSQKKQIMITWNQKQPERDIVGYNLFRKLGTSNDFSFSRINRNILSIRENFYIDDQVDFDQYYTYALQTIDVHNNTSKFSLQKATKIQNQDFSIGRVENDTLLVVDRELEDGEIVENEEKDIISFKNKMTLTINPLFQNLDKESTFLLKVKSLDTFEEKEIKLNFKTRIIKHVSSVPSEKAEDQRDEIETRGRVLEKFRFGISSEEALRRTDRSTRGRDGFEE